MRVRCLLSSVPYTVVAAALFGAVSAQAQEDPAARVVLGNDTIVVEVADDYPERVLGLQNRSEVPEGTGMLFQWAEPAPQSFWMHGTEIDLDIAFIDASGRIVKLATMRAGSRETVNSGEPVLYALEVRAGWFAEKGVAVGDVVEILPGPFSSSRTPGRR